MNNSLASINNRIFHRRQLYSRLPGKRPILEKYLPRISPPAPSDSSNDSGLDVDGINHYYHHHQQQQQQQQKQQQLLQHPEYFSSILSNVAQSAIVAPTIVQQASNFLIFNHHRVGSDSFTLSERHHKSEDKDEQRRPKRPRMASIALESEDACSDEAFMMNQRCGGSEQQQQQQHSPINYSAKRCSEPLPSK